VTKAGAQQVSRWVKGQSGNPAGAKKTAYKENFDQLMAKKRMHDEGTQIVAEKWADIIESMASIAILGNVEAAKFLRDTFIGKPKEVIDHNLSDNSKIEIKLNYGNNKPETKA